MFQNIYIVSKNAVYRNVYVDLFIRIFTTGLFVLGKKNPEFLILYTLEYTYALDEFSLTGIFIMF